MSTAIWWIRRDLRLTDNQALHAALQQADNVLPVFVFDPAIRASSWYSERRQHFLLGGLDALAAQLQARGSRLILRSGAPELVLPQLLAESGATLICAERDHTPYATARDQRVARLCNLLLTEGVAARPVGSVRSAVDKPYTVFTPYSRKWQQQATLQPSVLLPSPAIIATPANIASLPLPTYPTNGDFPPGEVEAQRRLENFVQGEDGPIYDYANQRDLPAAAATSPLSPYLRLGMISARAAAVAAYTAIQRATTATAQQSAQSWLNELIWRDFYITILHEFPHVRRGSFRVQYNAIRWANNEDDFAAWCAGQTGYPFVDAAMRQLTATGWMHNRARMVVASFLVKDLLIDWRWGERWFMQNLLDGDPAANNGGWQWSAGTGTDAAPYFRIFNPVAQSEKFDPAGLYIRQWVPELAAVPLKYLHQPWVMPLSEQLQAHCRVGSDYPAPLVDHAWARQRLLAAYTM